MSTIIAIANEKGGVAKTTTVVSLGGALAEFGQRVLVIDLDPQANLTLALGVKPREVARSISHVMLNNGNPVDAIMKTNVANLSLIPSNAEMGLAERFLPVRQDYHTILQKSLDGNLGYDFILFDCPPALGAITLNALTAANLLIIPTQAEYFSAYALKSMMTAVRQVRNQGNPSLVYRVLVTMLDRRNRTHRTLVEQLKATFGDGLLETAIEMDTKLRESPIVGLPIMQYMSQSRSAEQYRALGREILENVERIQEKAVAHSA